MFNCTYVEPGGGRVPDILTGANGHTHAFPPLGDGDGTGDEQQMAHHNSLSAWNGARQPMKKNIFIYARRGWTALTESHAPQINLDFRVSARETLYRQCRATGLHDLLFSVFSFVLSFAFSHIFPIAFPLFFALFLFSFLLFSLLFLPLSPAIGRLQG